MSQFLSIVWQGEPLQYLIIILFGGAFFIESYSTFQYCNKELKSLANIIEFLQKNQSSRKLSKNIIWLRENIAGKVNTDGQSFSPDKQDNLYVFTQYPVILSRSVPRSFLRFIPTLCTALGLLGTFYGISIGLTGMSHGITQSQELLNSANTLFGGMRTAFSNSLLGLGSASLFTVVMFVCERLRQRYRNRLRKQLSEIAIVQNAFQNLANLDFSANTEAAESLGKTAEIMQTGFKELVTIQRQLTPQEIGQQVGIALTPVFNEIRQELSILREIKQDQGQEVLQNLILSLRTEVLEPIMGRLDQSATLTTEASQAVKQLTNELGGITQSLATSILTIEKFQKDTLVRLENFADNLQQTFSEFQSETQNMLGQQSNTLRSVGDEAASLMHDARDSLVSGLQNIDGIIQNTSQIVQQELEQFRLTYQASLQGFFAEQNNLLEGSLGQQREGLAEVVANLQGIFQEETERRRQLSQSMDKIQETVRVVRDLASAVGLSDQEKLLSLKQHVRDISHEVREAQNQYKTILEDWSSKLTSRQFEFFQQADIGIANVAENLLQAANVLAAAESNRQLTNGHHKP
jgi:MotA/TolQ/ExbB proton channel family